jgi:hypothetical protein
MLSGVGDPLNPPERGDDGQIPSLAGKRVHRLPVRVVRAVFKLDRGEFA